jgi:hypothetical protein
MVIYDFSMICKIALEFYLFQLLSVDGLEFVLHNYNVNTFENLDPSNMRHGIFGKKLSLHNNGELS